MSCGTCGCSPCQCAGCQCPAPVVNVFPNGPAPVTPTVPSTDDLTAYWEPLQESFVMPLVGGEFDIRVIDSDRYCQFMWVGIPDGTGVVSYLQIISRPTATSIRVSNVGAPGNMAPGTTIGAGTQLIHGLPQESAGVGGPLNLADELTDDFTIPAGAANAKIQTTAWCYLGMMVFCKDGLNAPQAFFTITAIVDAVTVELTNTGDPSNSAVGTVLPTGSFIHPVRTSSTGASAALSIRGRPQNTIGPVQDFGPSAPLQYLRENAAGTGLEWSLLPTTALASLFAPGTSGLRVYVGDTTRTILATLYWSAGLTINFPTAFTNATSYWPFALIIDANGTSLPGPKGYNVYIERTANTGMTLFVHRSYDPGDDPPAGPVTLKIAWIVVGS